MKAIILAGGLGTRLSEETTTRPKPLVEIGGKPILWHIMKMYSAHGIDDFIVCLGYKGHMIKEFFANYTLHMSDITFDVAHSRMTTHRNEAENWRVTLIDTGEATMTGGRLGRVMGMVVDSVSDVTTLTAQQIRPAPDMGGVFDSDYLIGLGTLDERMLILVDIDKLMSSREMGLIEGLAT